MTTRTYCPWISPQTTDTCWSTSSIPKSVLTCYRTPDMYQVAFPRQNHGCLLQNVERVFLPQPSLTKEVFLQESMIGLPLSMIVLNEELCIRGFIHRRRRDLQAAEAKLEKRDRLVSAIITIYLKWATYTLDGSIIEVWGFLRKALVLRRILLMVVCAPSFICPRRRHLRISVPHRRRWRWYARRRRRCLEVDRGVYSRAGAVNCISGIGPLAKGRGQRQPRVWRCYPIPFSFQRVRRPLS